MKRALLTSVLFTVSFLLTSCAFHQGIMENSASLGSANFSYIKQTVQGDASATYILGIGGLGKHTLVDEAKQRMVASSPLKNNQALANITVNFKTTYAIVFVKVKCTVTADIVEFK